MVPLSRPVLGTLAIFKFLLSWNDYLWPLVMIRAGSDVYADHWDRPDAGAAGDGGRRGADGGGSVIATVPVLMLVFAMQRQFLRGITTGAIKG